MAIRTLKEAVAFKNTMLSEEAPMYNVTHPDHGIIGTHQFGRGFVPSKPHLPFKAHPTSIPNGAKIDKTSKVGDGFRRSFNRMELPQSKFHGTDTKKPNGRPLNKSMQTESHDDDWDDDDFDDQRVSDDPAHKISPNTINKYGRAHIEHDGITDVTKPGASTPTHVFKNPHPKGSPKHKNFGKDLQDGLTDAGAEPYKVTQHPVTGHATVEYTNKSLTGNPDDNR